MDESWESHPILPFGFMNAECNLGKKTG
jgi:hypothetical protein